MMYTVYDVNDNAEHLFVAASPYNAMEKMLYTLNLSRLDKNAEIKETRHGYLLTHDNEEYWTRR